MKLVLLALVFWSFTSSTLAQNKDKLDELTLRIEQLERTQEELLLQSSGPSNPVNSFLRNNLTIGGFLETSLMMMEGPDTELQALNTSNLLGLNIAAELGPRWNFLTQTWVATRFPLVNEDLHPGVNGGEREFGSLNLFSALTQGYVEYTFSDKFRVQAGFGFVPFGHYLQQREIVLYIRRDGPQLLRTHNLVGQLWNGIHFLGEFSRPGGGEWGYNLYTNNSFTPRTSSQLGLGGRTWMANTDESLVAGLSGQIGKFRGHTDEVVGSDLRWKNESFLITTEYVRHITEGEDPWSLYFEPGIFVREGKWLLFAFGDYAESTLNTEVVGGSPTADPYKLWEYGAGLNWLPSVYTRFRFTFTYHDYIGENATLGGRNRDYYHIDLSAGVAF